MEGPLLSCSQSQTHAAPAHVQTLARDSDDTVRPPGSISQPSEDEGKPGCGSAEAPALACTLQDSVTILRTQGLY